MMFKKSRRFVASVFVLVAVLVLGCATAFAGEYPDRDIKAICPWGAGGGVDAITRMMTKIAEQYLPASFYVVNIEGGTGSVGTYEVMKAKPDGYTIGSLSYDHIVTVPRYSAKILPEYDLKKLRMLCLVTREGGAVVVRSDSRWKTFEDMVAYAKKHPGKVTFGVDGLGSGNHLRALAVADRVGLKLNFLPYPGGAGPQKEAILSGEIDAALTSLGDYAPLIQSGQCRGLAVMEAKRNPAFPDVPTFNDLGYEGLVMGSFVILAAPAGTPDDRMVVLEEAFNKAHHSEEFRSWADSVGIVPSWLGSKDVTQMVQDTQEQAFGLLDRLVKAGALKE